MANDLEKISDELRKLELGQYDNQLRKYGISSAELRSKRALEISLAKVLGESRKPHHVGLELRIELQKLGYRIAKIPKPRSS